MGTGVEGDHPSLVTVAAPFSTALSVLQRGFTSVSLEGNTSGSNFADSLRTAYGSVLLQKSFFYVSPKGPLTQVKSQDSLLVKLSFTGVSSPRTQHTVKSLGQRHHLHNSQMPSFTSR